jgi:hypothetical protein
MRPIAAAAVIVLAVLSATPVEAYQVKRVLRGEALLPKGAETLQVDLSPSDGKGGVDPSRSLVLVSGHGGRLGTPEGRCLARLENSTTLRLARSDASEEARVAYQVIEFGGGVSILSGVVTVPGRGAGRPAAAQAVLPRPVNLRAAFPVVTMTSRQAKPGGGSDENALFTAELISPTVLQFARDDFGDQYATDIAYQVVDFGADPDVRVQHGTAVVGPEAASASVRLDAPLEPVNPGRTLLFFTTRAPGAITARDAKWSVDGTLADGGTLTFSRVSPAGVVTVVWYAVEFLNEALVQRGRAIVGTDGVALGADQPAARLRLPSAVHPERSAVLVSASGGDPLGLSAPGMDQVRVSAQLKTERDAAGLLLGAGTLRQPIQAVSWFVAEFPALTLTHPPPRARRTVRVGETLSLRWDHAMEADHPLTIELLREGAPLAPPIGSGVRADEGRYDWTVPEQVGGVNAIGGPYQIRLTGAVQDGRSRNTATSTAAIIVRGRLELVAPNGGETWPIGATDREITWRSWGRMGRCALSYSLQGDGGPWTAIDDRVECGEGGGTVSAYRWSPVPDAPSRTVRIRIEDVDGPPAETFDISDADAEIRPTLTIERPRPASAWPVGRCRTIQWAATGTMAAVDLFYGSGTSDPRPIATGLRQGSFPCGSACWYVGDGRTTGCEVSDPANPEPAACAKGKSCFDWIIPRDTPSASSVRITVQQTGHAAVMAKGPQGPTGEETFRLIPSIDLTSPDGGEVWRVNELRPITWSVLGGPGITAVDLLYTTEAQSAAPAWRPVMDAMGRPADDVLVSACPAGVCTFTWKVPDEIGSALLVKVEDASAPAPAVITDRSAAPFQIVGKLAVTEPRAGAICLAGNEKMIRWTADGSIASRHGRLSIALDTGEGYGRPFAADLDPSAQEYRWLVPSQPSDLARIKIYIPRSGGAAAEVAAESQPFRLQQLTITQPTSGTSWEIGSNPPPLVAWTPVGEDASPDNDLEILYSLTGGAPFLRKIASGVRFREGQAPWPLRSDVIRKSERNAQVRVRLQLLNDPDHQGVESESFTIKARLRIVEPNRDTPPWHAAQPMPPPGITWTTDGYVGSVNLWYGTAGDASQFSDAHLIAGGVANCAAVGSCANAFFPQPPWIVPEAATSPSARIKIASAEAPEISAVSSGFKITAFFSSVQVGEGRALSTGDARVPIRWETGGTIPSVTISYQCDGREEVILAERHAGHRSGGNLYRWKEIPDERSESCRVRIADAADPANAIVSDAFAIRPRITVTQPTDLTELVAGADALIRWTTTGTKVTRVGVAYRVGEGPFLPIGGTDRTPAEDRAGGSLMWKGVPEAGGMPVVVRVSDATPGVKPGSAAEGFSAPLSVRSPAVASAKGSKPEQTAEDAEAEPIIEALQPEASKGKALVTKEDGSAAGQDPAAPGTERPKRAFVSDVTEYEDAGSRYSGTSGARVRQLPSSGFGGAEETEEGETGKEPGTSQESPGRREAKGAGAGPETAPASDQAAKESDADALESLPRHDAGEYRAEEGRPVKVTLKAAGADAGYVELSSVALPDGAEFEDHRDGTGTLQWTPRYDQGGSHEALIKVGRWVGDATINELAVLKLTVRESSLAISGTIVDPLTESPFRGAMVQMSTSSQLIQEATTDANGYYLLKVAKPGTYKLKPKYTPPRSFASGRVKRAKQVTFIPPYRWVTVEAKDVTGIAFEGAPP